MLPVYSELVLTFPTVDAAAATWYELSAFNARMPHYAVSSNTKRQEIKADFKKLTLKLKGSARNLAAALADPDVRATFKF